MATKTQVFRWRIKKYWRRLLAFFGNKNARAYLEMEEELMLNCIRALSEAMENYFSYGEIPENTDATKG